VTAEATRWLYDQGVRVMGIDAWGWDRPLRLQAADALAQDAPGIFWEAHQADLPYSQIERLVNLGELPPDGFTVSCLPLRAVGASAAPARGRDLRRLMSRRLDGGWRWRRLDGASQERRRRLCRRRSGCGAEVPALPTPERVR